MSNLLPTNSHGQRDDRTWALVAAFLGSILLLGALIIGIALAVPESANPAGVITYVGIGFSTFIPALAAAIIAGRSSQKLDRVLNGEMDGKIERGSAKGFHAAMDERQEREGREEQTP